MCVTINYRNDVRSAILTRLKTPRFYSFLRLASRLDSSAARHKLLPLQYRKDQTVRSRGQKMRVGGGAGVRHTACQMRSDLSNKANKTPAF